MPIFCHIPSLFPTKGLLLLKSAQEPYIALKGRPTSICLKAAFSSSLIATLHPSGEFENMTFLPYANNIYFFGKLLLFLFYF